MNVVVLVVMANSRLNKKDIIKINDYNIDDLHSNDEWIVEEDEVNSTLDASNEDILIEIGEVSSVVATHL